MNKKVYTRAFYERDTDPHSDGDPLRFVASTEGLARDGLVIESTGWQLEAYKSNPVVLWAHDYFGKTLPIGKTVDVKVENSKLVADVIFDQSDEFARSIERKYRTGFLNAVSVGWNTLQIKPSTPGSPARITKAELLDISSVPVPGDPDALLERQFVALRSLLADNNPLLRGAIPPHTTDKVDEGMAWDGPGEVGKAEGSAQLRRMHAWVDEEQDPETKQAYKLPHHLATGEVVWRGVAAAMARLLQAGTQIPDADRRGVYNHLSRHYGQFDKEAPEFRSIEDLLCLTLSDIRGLFLEGEDEIVPEAFTEELRIGAVLSKRNRQDLEQAISLINGVLERAKKEDEEPSDQEESDEADQDVERYLRSLELIKIRLGGL